MKTRLLILILLTFFIMAPVTSFAEKHSVCNFGDESTPTEYLFENDFAVKAFFEMHPDATQTLMTDKSGNAINQIAVESNDGVIKETLMLKFNVDTKGCYIPAYYDYLYDDGDIGPQVRNSVSNFTEIVDLIRTEQKTIADFYPDDCQFVDLDVLMTSGKSFGVCKKTASRGVTILIDSASSGSLEIDLPIQMVYSLPSKDCKPTGDFLVLMEDGETSYEITPTDIGNRVQVEFSEGFHKIQILGSMIIPSPSPAQYCGIVEGYLDKQYLAPLDQTDHGVAAKSVRCNDGLTLIQKHDGSPACVSKSTQNSLWHRDWANKSTDIYKAYTTPQILDEFHSKLISEDEALRIIEEFIDETNLVLDADTTDPNFVITSNLEYDTLKRQSQFQIDPHTGLPTETASPELEGFYRTPNWYADLQRDYLGMSSQRIEDGHVAWDVSYRACSMCHDYASFFVDAITGDVLDTRNIDEMFLVSDIK